jgi:hypothetical protein
MNILTQFVPLLLVLVYIGLVVFAIVLVVRFVRAHERIARALEDAATTLRRQQRNGGGS